MATPQEIGLRIEQRRKELNMTLNDIADAIGVARSTIQRYEKGTITKVKLPVIEAIANTLKVNPAWIVCKTDDPTPVASTALPAGIIPIPKMKRVPLIGTIACGSPILAVEDATEFVTAPETLDIDFALECKGDSMINARIFPGDIVYIKKQPVVENGEIAAVLIGEEATLKKVYYTPGTDRIVLQACNPLYADMVYSGEQLNEIKILGKAVWFMSKVRT